MSGKKKHHRQADDEGQEEGGYGRLQDKGVSPLARFAGVHDHTLADTRPPAQEHGRNPLTLRCALR
jgi:hypothetical protein